jgi:hypothetical protein
LTRRSHPPALRLCATCCSTIYVGCQPQQLADEMKATSNRAK